jgi:hypothetical protein
VLDGDLCHGIDIRNDSNDRDPVRFDRRRGGCVCGGDDDGTRFDLFGAVLSMCRMVNASNSLHGFGVDSEESD